MTGFARAGLVMFVVTLCGTPFRIYCPSCRYLLSADLADINKRDRWDSVPLYYACLAGHAEMAAALLDAGAVCNEYTFDGDRCHYAGVHRNR